MKQRVQSGFTLIEMIVTISIASLLFIAVVIAIVIIYQANREAIRQAAYIDSARQGLEIFTRDVREIDYAVTGAYPLVVMLPYEFSFYSDIDPDDLTELIRYELSSSSLIRTVYSATGTPPVYNIVPDSVATLATNIRNVDAGVPSFTYFDRFGVMATNTALQISDIRSVGISLFVNPDFSTTTSDFVLDSIITLRNLRDRL